MNDSFRVAMGRVTMASRDELFAQGGVVVDFSVEDDPEGAIFVADGLVAGRQIDDAEAPHAQAHGTVRVHALIVGSAVHHRLAHSPDGSGVDPLVLRKPHYPGNSTHGRIPFP